MNMDVDTFEMFRNAGELFGVLVTELEPVQSELCVPLSLMMRVDHAALAIVYRWTFDLEGDSHFLQVSLDSQALSQRCPSTFARHISEDWKRKFAETAKSLSQPR